MIAWLKAKWEWVAGGFALLAAIVVGLLVRRPKPLPAPDDVQKKAEEDTKQEEQKAQEEHDAEVQKILDQHAATVQTLDDDQKKKVDELSNSPEELNQFLLDVGKDIRSP